MSVREAGVQVKFFKLPTLHGVQSAAAGRQVFVDVDHVEIIVAGQDKQKFVGPANEQIQARFPEEYAQFLAGQQEVRSGTPIEQWPQLTPSQVLMLKQLNVYSVEDVSSLSDENVRNLGPGGYKLRDDAGKYLKSAKVAADAGKIDEMMAQMASLIEANKALTAKVAELEKPAESKKKKETA
jgi:hypothetical protein